MTKDEAFRIIEANVGFNILYFPHGMRPEEESILIARKRALANAWRVVGELDSGVSAEAP